jgi:hypothetical protein
VSGRDEDTEGNTREETERKSERENKELARARRYPEKDSVAL